MDWQLGKKASVYLSAIFINPTAKIKAFLKCTILYHSFKLFQWDCWQNQRHNTVVSKICQSLVSNVVKTSSSSSSSSYIWGFIHPLQKIWKCAQRNSKKKTPEDSGSWKTNHVFPTIQYTSIHQLFTWLLIVPSPSMSNSVKASLGSNHQFVANHLWFCTYVQYIPMILVTFLKTFTLQRHKLNWIVPFNVHQW